MNEFDLIRRYFCFSTSDNGLSAKTASGESISLGVGDDCALVNLLPGHQLAITTDTLVNGVHFPEGADAELIARRALRVNLSDLAAMGATPLGFQLALTIPEIDTTWLEKFSTGLAEDAKKFQCPLIGGDTTRGPLSITITMMGTVEKQNALRRKGASAGDIICVSGTLGDAIYALEQLFSDSLDEYLIRRYWLPEPRIQLGRVLGAKATAGLDVSDGILQDVGHIARANRLTACVEFHNIPLSRSLLSSNITEANARRIALSGGDDYELCFTIDECVFAEVEKQATELGCRISKIGRMLPLDESGEAVICVDLGGNRLPIKTAGYDHFRK